MINLLIPSFNRATLRFITNPTIFPSFHPSSPPRDYVVTLICHCERSRRGGGARQSRQGQDCFSRFTPSQGHYHIASQRRGEDKGATLLEDTEDFSADSVVLFIPLVFIKILTLPQALDSIACRSPLKFSGGSGDPGFSIIWMAPAGHPIPQTPQPKHRSVSISGTS